MKVEQLPKADQSPFGYQLLDDGPPSMPKRTSRFIAQVENKKLPWILQVDGSASAGQGGAGIYLKSPKGADMEYVVSLRFKVTNNEAEYEAILGGLKMAKAVEVDSIEVQTDSQLIAKQFSGEFKILSPSMKRYAQ